MSQPPICPACGSAARLTSGAEIYPHRPDLADKPIWCCPVCPQTYVGCHPETTDALGTPAGPELRRARMNVHGMLDRLWRKPKGPVPPGSPRPVSRSTAYGYLSWALGLDGRETHVGMFDLARCAQAHDALKGVTVETLRDWTPPRPTYVAPDPRPPMPIEHEHKFLMRDPPGLYLRLQKQEPAQILEQSYVRGRARFSTDEAGAPSVTLRADDPTAMTDLVLPVSPEDHALATKVAQATGEGVPGEIRFRSITAPDGASYFVTFKMPVGEDLLEVEEPIPAETFGSVLSRDRLRKTRFTLPAYSGHWDIDFIHAPDGEAIVLGLIELEGATGQGFAVHPLLENHLGARVPRADHLLFTNRRFCDPDYAATVVDRYVSGALLREGLATGVPGVTVFHAKFGHSPELYEGVCGAPDAELIAAVRTTIAQNGYRAVARFSTDSLEDARAMTIHGRLYPGEAWQNRHEPARYRFHSQAGRTKEHSSEAGALFVLGGEGYVLADGPSLYGKVTGYRFLAVGPVDAEAVRQAYPWP